MRRINLKYIKRVAAGLLILIFLIAIIGFFVLPPLIKPFLIEKTAQAIHRDVALEKISMNPFTLSVTLKGLNVKDKGQPSSLLSFDELHINLEGPASLLKRALIIKEVRLTKPYVHIARNEDGAYNFSDLIPAKSEPKKDEKPFHFSVNNIHVLNGGVDFDDKPMKTRHTIRDMNLAIPFISNVAHAVDQYVEPKFSAKINGEPYVLSGKAKPFSADRETSLDLDIRNVDLPSYLNYVPVKLNCKLSSAILDAKLGIHFVMPQGTAPSIKLKGQLVLSKIILDDLQGEKILRLPTMQADLESVEPLAGDVHLSKFLIRSPDLVVRKSQKGEINLLNLVARSAQKKPEAPKKQATPAEKKTALKVRIDEFAIESASLAFLDKSPADPVQILVTPLDLKFVNLSTEKGSTGQLDLSLVLNQQGKIKIKGPVGLEPMHADLEINANEIGVKPFQPYFTDKIRINVARGDLSTSGRLTLDLKTEGKPGIRYTGKVALARLATFDKATSSRFLNWKQLYFDQVDAGLNPFSLNIKGVSLADFYARISVDPDGTLNLQKIFVKPEKTGPETVASQKPQAAPAKDTAKPEDDLTKNIKIGKVTLQGGTIDFMDQFIKPNYSAKMLNIGGSVTGLSTEEISRAKVDLRGNLGLGSPIEITGTINPLIKDLYADIKLSFKDIELSSATPYAVKYLGYPIMKGKLTFDVAYLIEKRKLNAQNKVFIDQLTFGDRVESPDAIKAPVTMAVSLLTDRNGQINLDIPVSGSLDDPKFSVWPIIWQVIVNLITKAVMAPFSLIASLFGGGEELSYIEFDYGSDAVTAAGEQKIKNLTKALFERPALKLDITGFVDAEKDQEGLKRMAFERKLKAQKMKDLTRKGAAVASLDQIKIEPSEYNAYLTAAYAAETFPKPRTVIGLAKSLPPEEMEKLMLAHTSVTASDLRLLASRRAEHVKEIILKSSEVQPGRIFIVEPPSLKPEKKEKAKESRVDFKLK